MYFVRPSSDSHRESICRDLKATWEIREGDLRSCYRLTILDCLSITGSRHVTCKCEHLWHPESAFCRGFAFVDFLSKQEARSAADAVAGTHLYGRRLVSPLSVTCGWSSPHVRPSHTNIYHHSSHTRLSWCIHPMELNINHVVGLSTI